MTTINKKSQFVNVAQRFLRSINVHSDYQHHDSTTGYIVTPNVAQALESLSEGLSHEKGQRAFALTGPYGTGKSAFAVFLCQLLGNDVEQAKHAKSLLAKHYKNVAETISQIRMTSDMSKGFLLVPVTARRRPIVQLLLEGLYETTKGMAPSPALTSLCAQITEALDLKIWDDTSVVLRCLSALQDEAIKQSYSGVLLLVDEAGKTLEYALQDRSGGDVYIFQELAEYANRQNSSPLLFLIMLHQMFDDYVSYSDKTLRNEWNKVQERFQAIQFNESASTTVALIATALEPKKEFPKYIITALSSASVPFREGAISLPFGLSYKEFAACMGRAWPLHPSTLLAMPYLFRRLGQNERSIFSYLTSGEPFAFQSALDMPLSAKEDSFVRLHHIYRYLLANFESSLARLPYAKRILEANHIINTRNDLTPSQLELIQTVALLNILAEVCPLCASIEMLRSALACSKTLEQDIEHLQKQSILIYRRLDSSYRIWEGSDVDIEARMDEARRTLQIEASSLEMLFKRLYSKTLVARRHSLKTGVNRYWNLIYTKDLATTAEKEAKNIASTAGTIMVLLQHAHSKDTLKDALAISQKNSRLMVALPTQIDALRGVAEEVACLRWVIENTPELRDDRIARREVDLRLALGEQQIIQNIQTLLDPRNPPAGNACLWIWQGEIKKLHRPVDVTKLLSEACDTIYSKSPRVLNELVVREKISSAAAGARRRLLEAMIKETNTPLLGIEGYPPERSMYESVLKASGIHSFDKENDQWIIGPPPVENPCNLYPCWDVLERAIFNDSIKRIKLNELFSLLSTIPYGMPEGLHPILFIAFYVYHQDELFLYREGTYLPQLEISHIELMQRRPDLFSISGARLSGTRKAVVKRLAHGLNSPAQTASIVRKLLLFLQGLPPLTQRTKRITDKQAMRMRDTLLNATAPEQVLFVDLPKCFDLEPFLEGQERQEDMDTFFAKLNNSITTLQGHEAIVLDRKKKELLAACGLFQGDSGWRDLERRAAWLAPRIEDKTMAPFLQRIINGASNNHNARPALSFVVNSSLEHWTDKNLRDFKGLASGIGERFQKLWTAYGNNDLFLTKEELKQKDDIRCALDRDIAPWRAKGQERALAAALRDLLRNLEIHQK